MLLRVCMLMIGCVVAIGLFTEAKAQITEDVIYLKNGSVVRGIIVEQIPNETLRIRTRGGSEFVFKMSEVLKITKELPIHRESPMPVQQEREFPMYVERKSPGIALLLSFLIAGGGQLYAERYDAGITHLIIGAVSGILLIAAVEDNYSYYDPDDDDNYAAVGLLVGLTNWVVSMVSAPSQARAFNERQHRKQGVSLIEDRLLLESYTSGKAEGAMLSLRF